MNIRTFHIPTEASLADPAWVIACSETTKDGEISYSNYGPLKELLANCERKQAENVGAAKEFDRILKMFGAAGYRELVALAEKCKAQKEAA